MSPNAERRTGSSRQRRHLCVPGLLALVLALLRPSPLLARSSSFLQGPPGDASPSYSTLLGGSSWDAAYGLTVDEGGAAYVVGRTPSADFPTAPGALDATAAGIDAFVAKMAPSGGGLDYATFLGGSGDDSAYAVAVEDGVVYVAGETWSSDFVLTSGPAGESDAFVAALDASGGGLIYATLLGGTDQESAYGLAVEDGFAYVTGITWSDDFPAEGQARGGDAFVVKLEPDGGVAYARLIGGSNVDAGFAITVRNGEAYLTGESSSFDFPAAGFRGGRDAFIVRLDTGGAIASATLIGGSGDERGNGLVLDADQNIYVAGGTNSSDLPGAQGAYAGGQGDAFLLKVGADGDLAWSLYMGGDGLDEAQAIALDAGGSLYLTGSTASAGFPVTADAFQAQLGGRSDAFLLVLEPQPEAVPLVAYGTFLGGAERDMGHGVAVDPQGAPTLTGFTESADFPTTSAALSGELSGGQDAFLSGWGGAEPVVPPPTTQPSNTPTAGPTPTATATAVGPSATSLTPTISASAPPVSPTAGASRATATPISTGAAGRSPTPSSAQGTPSPLPPAGATVEFPDGSPSVEAEGTVQVAQAASPGVVSSPTTAATSLSSSPEQSTRTSPDTEPEGGGSIWIWVLVIAAVLAAAAGGWMLWRKQ